MKSGTFLKRKPKSDIASLFVGVTQEKDGRPKVLVVPGSQGKRYRVILRRSFTSTANGRMFVISAECAVETGAGHLSCPGNSPKRGRHTICYHSRAAIDFAVENMKKNDRWVPSGKKAHWCETYEDAKKISNMTKGQIVLAKSWQSEGVAWLVVKEQK